jgi:hypothetical protein
MSLSSSVVKQVNSVLPPKVSAEGEAVINTIRGALLFGSLGVLESLEQNVINEAI